MPPAADSSGQPWTNTTSGPASGPAARKHGPVPVPLHLVLIDLADRRHGDPSFRSSPTRPAPGAGPTVRRGTDDWLPTMPAMFNAVPTNSRVEDEGFLRGETAFLADLPGRLPARRLRPVDVAHGELRAVDAEGARAAPGVVAVLTAADLGLALFRPFAAVPEHFARPPLAVDRVRFVGEPVALVVADTAARAVDAAEPWRRDRGAPRRGGRRGGAGAGRAGALRGGRGQRGHPLRQGPPGGPLRHAARVVEGRFPNQRLASAPLEPSVIVVRPSGAGARCRGPRARASTSPVTNSPRRWAWRRTPCGSVPRLSAGGSAVATRCRWSSSSWPRRPATWVDRSAGRRPEPRTC